MDKVREEFEAWIKTEFDGCMPRRKGKGYLSQYVNGAWKAWQASRAALCVELPSQWFDDGLDCDLMEAHQVGKALDEAGVQYK